ncbi:Aste57867_12891 [Aphanomyces stellatus]|uniref:Aste57867_12891 protein n=1 Tax=Aphanomyces stellatus TaxID=120398 RepID=A0A485KYD2_9STRA|nr:hypothetical protein As57867_012843 [Aphanomyces stellatus]VFT89738.1 Aste57867_12891 [Aphanomyces stellatus]
MLPDTTRPVCVTGGTGFIGSYVVKTLLERGYTVHTTVRDVTNAAKLAHLTSLPGATDRLRFFRADLLEDGSFDQAIRGCAVVLHTASPCFFKDWSRAALVDPAVRGTLTVLETCAQTPSVRRVVLTSSISAVAMSMGTLPPTHVYTDADWSDQGLLEKHEMWYMLSKTIAERQAHAFMAATPPRSFDLVVLNPVWVFGPMLQPVVNESSDQIGRYLQGKMTSIPNAYRSGIDVRDVANAHVAAFENPRAHGRYLLCGWQVPEAHMCRHIRELVPTAPVPTRVDSKAQPRVLFDTTRAKADLGLHTYISMADSVDSTCQSLIEHGFGPTPSRL